MQKYLESAQVLQRSSRPAECFFKTLGYSSDSVPPAPDVHATRDSVAGQGVLLTGVWPSGVVCRRLSLSKGGREGPEGWSEMICARRILLTQ